MGLTLAGITVPKPKGCGTLVTGKEAPGSSWPVTGSPVVGHQSHITAEKRKK